jgi:predicted dehydrogenase
LGCGSIAPYHLRAWRRIEDVEIVALANRTVHKAEALAHDFGLPREQVYSDYLRLLDVEQLDFVDIATAPQVHQEQVLAAVERGVHVLCQKPFAMSMDQALQMIATCQARGVRCVVNENWRWRPWYRRLKADLDQGTIGTPRYARFQHHSDGLLPRADGQPPALVTTQAYTVDMPKLILFEWGIHLIDVLRFLFGDVHSVYARMDRISPVVAGEDRAVITLTFCCGLIALVDICWSTPVPERGRLQRGNLDQFIVEGDIGAIELDPYQDDAYIVVGPKGTERYPARGELTPGEAYQLSYVRAQSHFAQCLRSGRAAENEASDNLRTLAIVFAAYESAEQNRVVFLDHDLPL